MNEEALRAQVVEIGRRLWQRGYVCANDGNVSVRLADGSILCTPTSTSKGFMEPDELVVVSPAGVVLDAGSGRGPSSEIRMHLRCYAVDPSVQAVVHAHPVFATSFAVRGEALSLPLMTESVVALPEVPLAPFALPSTTEVPDSVEPFVRSHRACLLEHHGALAWGASLEEAMMTMERLEHQAQVTATTRMLGGSRELSPARVAALRALG